MNDDVNQKILTTFSGVASSLGFSEVHGMIIGTVLVTNKLISLQEIARRTGYSLSSISISIDLLELVGVVRKIKKRGDRNVYVRLEGDLLESLKKAFLMKMHKEIAFTKNELQEYRSKIRDPKTRKTIGILQNEVERLSKYLLKLSEVELPK